MHFDRLNFHLHNTPVVLSVVRALWSGKGATDDIEIVGTKRLSKNQDGNLLAVLGENGLVRRLFFRTRHHLSYLADAVSMGGLVRACGEVIHAGNFLLTMR